MKVSRMVCAAGAAVAVCAAAARADTLWETQVRFLIGGVPTTNLAVSDGPVDITIQAGIFNLTGQGTAEANHGLNMWSGRIASTAAGLNVDAASARIAPYNYGPSSSFGGFVTGGGTGIDGSSTAGSLIYSARAIAPTEAVPWTLGNPQPTGPTEYGLEGFVSVYRFQFIMSAAAGAGTTISASGSGGPVLRWTPMSTQIPDVSEPNGFVTFLGLSPTPILRVYNAPTLTLTRVPAPGTGAALLALVPMAARRRRR